MPADKYRWRERFTKTRFTVLAEEYAATSSANVMRWQIWNAAQRHAPGKRVRIKITEQGDLVVRVERRVRLTPVKGVPGAGRAA